MSRYIRHHALLIPLAMVLVPGFASATTIFLTSGTSWTVPSDWNNSNNSIEVIGGAGGGGGGDFACAAGGGGGGAYSKISNLSLTPGSSKTYSVGSAGSAGTSGGDGGPGGDTYFNAGSCGASSVCAKGGAGGKGSTNGCVGGAGGLASEGVGTTKYNGGTGANNSGDGGGGGGGGGPNGAGNNGSTTTGGSGGAGSGGAGGSANNPGSDGAEFDATHGSGGGGGGGTGFGVGKTGGNYGGAGGGGDAAADGAVGKQGLIVITYAPASPLSGTLTINSAVTAANNVSVAYNLSKGSGTFVIDHPLDPKNKLLYHSFVESPDVLNMYAGTALLDSHGDAAVTLPDYFEALNGDERYFVRPIGRAMPGLFIRSEVRENRFVIGGGSPGGTVSWTVMGVRHDPYIIAHPVIAEVEKGPGQPVDRGEYLFKADDECSFMVSCAVQKLMHMFFSR